MDMKPQIGQACGDSLAQKDIVRTPLKLWVEDNERVVDNGDNRYSFLPGFVCDLLQCLEVAVVERTTDDKAPYHVFDKHVPVYAERLQASPPLPCLSKDIFPEHGMECIVAIFRRQGARRGLNAGSGSL